MQCLTWIRTNKFHFLMLSNATSQFPRLNVRQQRLYSSPAKVYRLHRRCRFCHSIILHGLLTIMAQRSLVVTNHDTNDIRTSLEHQKRRPGHRRVTPFRSLAVEHRALYSDFRNFFSSRCRFSSSTVRWPHRKASSCV